MNTFLRRIAAAFSLASLALSWPLAFASAQTAPALTKKVAFIGDSQATNLVCPALSNEQTITNSASLMDVRDNKIPKVLKQLGIESVAAKCRVGASTNWHNRNSQAYINNLPEDLDAIIVFSGGNDCNGLPNTCTNCSNHATEIPALLEKLNARRPKKIIWFTTFWVDATAVANEIHICANHIFPSYLASLSSRFPSLVPVNGWELTTDGIPRNPGDAHFRNAEYYYPTLSPRLSQKIAEIVGTGAGSSTGNQVPGVPATDTLGRTSEEVQQSIAARCTETNPVFPVRLGIAIGGTTEVNGLTEYINVVYRYMTAIVLVVAIVMVTFGGFKYLLAASPLGVKDGKDVIKNGIVGMVLVLSAYVILNTINPATTVLQFTKPPEDIVCRDFEAQLGQLRPGLSEAARQELRNTPVGSLISYWDPLLLRARPMISCNSGGTPTGTSDADAVRAIFSNLISGSCPASQVCVEADEYAGAISNRDLSQYSQGLQNFCSSGGLYSVCSAPEHCNADQGLICLGAAEALFHDEWQVCVKREGNEEGSPCGLGYPEPGIANRIEVGCATGLECVERQYNYPNDADEGLNALVTHRSLKVCAKSVPTAVLADIRTINGRTEVIPSSICKYHRDCREDGARCVSDDVSDNKRVCAPRNATDGAVCGLVREGNATQEFFPCNGSNGFTCVFCPDETNAVRNWTPLNGSNRLFDIGQCKPSEAVRDGLRCAGS